MADQPKTQHPRGLGCEDCECWHWNGGAASIAGGPMRKGMGQCRRNAPTPNPNYVAAADERWPKTSGIDWCWDLVSRKEATPEADGG